MAMQTSLLLTGFLVLGVVGSASASEDAAAASILGFCASKQQQGLFCVGNTTVTCCKQGKLWSSCGQVRCVHGCNISGGSCRVASAEEDNRVQDTLVAKGKQILFLQKTGAEIKAELTAEQAALAEDEAIAEDRWSWSPFGTKEKCCKCKTGTSGWSRTGKCSFCKGGVKKTKSVASYCTVKSKKFKGNTACAKRCAKSLRLLVVLEQTGEERKAQLEAEQAARAEDQAIAAAWWPFGTTEKCCKCKTGTTGWSRTGKCSFCKGSVKKTKSVSSDCTVKSKTFKGNTVCANQCAKSLRLQVVPEASAQTGEGVKAQLETERDGVQDAFELAVDFDLEDASQPAVGEDFSGATSLSAAVQAVSEPASEEGAPLSYASISGFCASTKQQGLFCMGSTRVTCCKEGLLWRSCGQVRCLHGCNRGVCSEEAASADVQDASQPAAEEDAPGAESSNAAVQDVPP